MFLFQVSTHANHFIDWRLAVDPTVHMASGQGSGSNEIRDGDDDDDDDDPGNDGRMCWSFCSDFMSFLFKAIAITKV